MTTPTRTNRAPRIMFPLAVAGAFSALAIAPTAAFAETTPVVTHDATAVAAAAPQAASGPFTATYGGAGVGYDRVLDGHAAGTVTLKAEDGKSVEVFCIEFSKDLATSGTFTAQTYTASGVANVAKAADLAAHHATIGKALTDAKAENAATQLAIWNLTDNKDFAKVPNASIVARATELVKGATAAAEPISSLVLTESATVTGTGATATDTVKAYLKTSDGKPVAGQKVTFTVAGTTKEATTDADGLATVTLDAPTAAATMTVTANAIVPAGIVFDPAGLQAMVSTSASSVTRTGTVALPTEPAAAVPTQEPTKAAPPVHHKPTPKPPVKHTPPPAPPKELPYTGGWATTGMLAGALSLAGLGYAGRRRMRRR